MRLIETQAEIRPVIYKKEQSEEKMVMAGDKI